MRGIVDEGYRELVSMAYSKGGVSLGNLTYTYDALGRKTSMGGSLARVGLPVALGSATYDAANRIVTRGGVTFAHDANGNLTSDGTTAYLYDGANPIQEKVGGTATVNDLGGLGMDEVYQRTDSGGARSLMVDGMNSMLGLMDATGASSTEYTYEPFWGDHFDWGGERERVSVYGAGGLMYYRERYCSPGLQRFISQDPLGFGGGDVNLYAYVGNGPKNGEDPTGERPGSWVGGHHRVPLSVIDRLVRDGILSPNGAARAFLRNRALSGPLVPLVGSIHCNDAAHRAYGDAVYGFLSTKFRGGTMQLSDTEDILKMLLLSKESIITDYIIDILKERVQMFHWKQMMASLQLPSSFGKIMSTLTVLSTVGDATDIMLFLSEFMEI